MDFGSSNGIHLNIRRVRPPVKLTDQDRSEVAGNVLFSHELEPADDAGGLTQATQATIKESNMAPRWLLVADIKFSTAQPVFARRGIVPTLWEVVFDVQGNRREIRRLEEQVFWGRLSGLLA